jgi:protein-tyrosine phosphatase
MTGLPPFRILVVCTGNICRSALIRSGLEARLGPATIVTSAGTHARDGDVPPPEMVAAADAVGIDLRDHRSARLSRDAIRSADLVVGAAREHRRHVATEVPRAARSAFTLPELARIASIITDDDLAGLAGASHVERLRSLVGLFGMLRGQASPPADPLDDDVVDPFGRADAVYAQSVLQMLAPLDAVGELLTRVR